MHEKNIYDTTMLSVYCKKMSVLYLHNDELR